MADTLHCTITTPEAQVFDAAVASVTLPSHDGRIGVLKSHAPMMVELGEGELSIEPTDRHEARTRYAIQGGFAQIKSNQLVVLTAAAEPRA
ncbi:ATP synthase F1 subunit epsilon [Phycisphaera mikurensis]|uniref:Putative ATP synthase subunit epsilon n=1 Tax=Phycisphaera mikurensis (strain NBRC 102666 / KCTC 22515 / FYK2301M01) TaxID=1142394 RepID=I0ICI2_PHYMF|nr:ATP synthase F1 subunit epsilon [Phycisphaera mikurensis]MBB6442154.1 ATP synthase F1 epsilon subunit [Phycisphaera mikurensis]BAM02970.1 putative ATP synthase subunit epsilon [Phycisphaera mikurensis NBRC 102666]